MKGLWRQTAAVLKKISLKTLKSNPQDIFHYCTVPVYQKLAIHSVLKLKQYFKDCL